MLDRTVVSNTSPLVYLHQIQQIGLLQSLYGRAIIPLAVQDELRAGAEIGFDVPDLDKIPWIEAQPLADRTLIPAVVDLGLGEAEAIALALSSPGSLLILDDALGRRVAQAHRLTYTGTLGVLVKANPQTTPTTAPSRAASGYGIARPVTVSQSARRSCGTGASKKWGRSSTGWRKARRQAWRAGRGKSRRGGWTGRGKDFQRASP
jgi:uncharacterized protein